MVFDEKRNKSPSFSLCPRYLPLANCAEAARRSPWLPVTPVHIISAYGADTARWFVLSDSPPERDVEWTASGAEAAHRHLSRVWSLSEKIAQMDMAQTGNGDEALLREMHKAIRDVTLGMEEYGSNGDVGS